MVQVYYQGWVNYSNTIRLDREVKKDSHNHKAPFDLTANILICQMT